MPDKLTIKTILYLREKFERDNWTNKTEDSWNKYLELHWNDCYYAIWKAKMLGKSVNY